MVFTVCARAPISSSLFTSTLPLKSPEVTAAQSLPIDCTGRYGVHLSFRRWLGVEMPRWDHAYVRVSSDGTNWVTVWRNNIEIADAEWTLYDIDISSVADNQPTVYLRWTMGTTDSSLTYCGWNIDDIRLTAAECRTGPPQMLPEPDGADKNRYVSMVIPTEGAGQETAIRVKLTSLHHPATPANPPDFTAWEGNYRWVNAVDTDPAGGLHTCDDSLALHTTFRCARLGCTPEYRDWAGELAGAPLHVTGAAAVPSSTYDAAQLAASCEGNEATCAAVSEELSILTTLFGNVDNDPQLNVLDVAAVVDKVKDLPSAFIKPRTQLQPDVPDPTANVNVLDAATAVDALKGKAYGYFGDFGPCTDHCPGEAACP